MKKAFNKPWNINPPPPPKKKGSIGKNIFKVIRQEKDKGTLKD